MAEYSVIIPSNSTDRLRKCVAAILATHPNLDNHKIVAVDDGIGAWPEKWPELTWVEGIKPFIWARNVNEGIMNAPIGDDLVIIGDDVTVKTDGAFDKLAETAQRANVAAVSPGIAGLVGNTHQVHRSAIVRETPNALCFVCVYIPRQWLRSVGYLDERFNEYGGEDTDWCWRAQAAGGRLLVDGRVVVHHNERGMESAFRSDPSWIAKSERATEILKQKWPEKFK